MVMPAEIIEPIADRRGQRRHWTVDILYARRRPRTSFSSATSCAKFDARKSVPSSFVSLCRCGENRFRFIEHCSLATGRNRPVHQGMTPDAVTGLYYSRNRNYSTTLGNWVSQDPARYIDGANTYQFVMGNPVGATDPSGLAGDETGGDDSGGDPQDGKVPPPPPENIWDVLTGLMFGVGSYEGPPPDNAPGGYQWGYPSTISAPGTPFDPNLWQLEPTNQNDLKTPWVNTQGPNGNTLTPAEQIAAVEKAVAASSAEQSGKPPAKAGPQCPEVNGKPPRVDDLSKAAGEADKGGLTRARRALQ